MEPAALGVREALEAAKVQRVIKEPRAQRVRPVQQGLVAQVQPDHEEQRVQKAIEEQEEHAGHVALRVLRETLAQRGRPEALARLGKPAALGQMVLEAQKDRKGIKAPKETEVRLEARGQPEVPAQQDEPG